MSDKKKTYTKSDLTRDMIGHFQEIPNSNIEHAVESIFKFLSNALASGRQVELRQFGTIRVKKMPARRARNPKTSEEIMIEEKNKVKWKSSKVLNWRLNKTGNKIEEE